LALVDEKIGAQRQGRKQHVHAQIFAKSATDEFVRRECLAESAARPSGARVRDKIDFFVKFAKPSHREAPGRRNRHWQGQRIAVARL
jgi:hypothetical protein